MKKPLFNLPTEIVRIFCSEHKKENMVDVKYKRCAYDCCMKRSNFNLPTEEIITDKVCI